MSSAVAIVCRHVCGSGIRCACFLFGCIGFLAPQSQAREITEFDTPSVSTVWLRDDVGMSTGTKYFQFHMRLERELREDPWASETENLLGRNLPSDGGFTIVGIECRTSRCEIRVDLANMDFGSWARAITALESTKWFKAYFSYSTGICVVKKSDPNSFVAYWIFDAVRELF